MYTSGAVPLVSVLVIAVLAASVFLLISIARRFLNARAHSETNAPLIPDLLQLPALRRRSRDPEYPCAAYLEASEGAFVDAVRRWRTLIVLGSRVGSDATTPMQAARQGGVVIVVGVNADAPSGIAAMNLALALGQLSRVLFIDTSDDATLSASSSAAPVDPSRASSAPVYWISGMIHRCALPQFLSTPGAQRAECLGLALRDYEWVVVSVSGACDIAAVLSDWVPQSATVTLIGSPGMSDVHAALAAARSALLDPQQLDGVVIVN